MTHESHPEGRLHRRLSRGNAFKLAGLAASLLVMVGGFIAVQSGRDVTAAICNDTVPEGALAPATPEWCQTPLNAGGSTFAAGANSWVDDFDHGLSHAELGQGYRVFDRRGFLRDSIHFRHNQHWMVDIQATSSDYGGATMRPDKSFRFENGKLIVEAEVAAGVAGYLNSQGGDEAWVELGVTTAGAPTGNTVDQLYAYGLYGGYDSFGCRLEASREVICALYAPNGSRTWEMSWFQHVAPTVFGGFPSGSAASAWRVCQGTDPDVNCRDKFRLELTKTSVVLYVNGVRYFEQSGTNLFPDALVNGDVYVYFSEWVYKPPSEVTRFHWDRLAVNPGSTGGGGGSTPTEPPSTPTSTPTPVTTTQATATPTKTPTPAPTVTAPDDTRCRIAIQEYRNNRWRTIRYETAESGMCSR